MNLSSQEQERTKEIAGLTRKYAQNRSLGVAVALLIITALSAGIAFLSAVGGIAYRDGNLVLLLACLVVLAPVLVAVVYMSVPKLGGRWLESLTGRLYPEGNVSISVPRQKRRQFISLILGVTFGCCVIGTVFLGLAGHIPPMYMQPISALYVVPFLLGIYVLMRPAISYVALLWPILYGLHAVLILVGVPIAFTGAWESLNIGLPMLVYGLLAALLGHAYNRYALHKLKQTTRINDTNSGETEGVSQR